jgi:hypothetical protein
VRELAADAKGRISVDKESYRQPISRLLALLCRRMNVVS